MQLPRLGLDTISWICHRRPIIAYRPGPDERGPAYGCASLLRPWLARVGGLRRFVYSVNPWQNPCCAFRPPPDPQIGRPTDPLMSHFAPSKLIYTLIRGFYGPKRGLKTT